MKRQKLDEDPHSTFKRKKKKGKEYERWMVTRAETWGSGAMNVIICGPSIERIVAGLFRVTEGDI